MRRIRTAYEQVEQLAAHLRIAMPRPEYYDTGKSPFGFQPDFEPGQDPDQTPVLPGPWYHATDADLQPGDELDPNRPNNFDYGPDGTWAPRDSKVFLTNNPLNAAGYGSNLYRVEPQGEGPFPWNGHGGYPGNSHGYASPSAKVVERYDDPSEFRVQWTQFDDKNKALSRRGETPASWDEFKYQPPGPPDELSESITGNPWARLSSPRPDRVNPQAPSEARPPTPMVETPLSQDALPGQEWAPEYDPHTLYRGAPLNLNHPSLAPLKDIVQGGGMFPDVPGSQGGDPAIYDHVMNYLNSGDADHIGQGGVGTHWSTDPSVANSFAIKSPLQDRQNYLPITLETEWDSLGEDPSRTGTGNKNKAKDWGWENEITLLPGAPMNVKRMRMMHPETQEWSDVPLPSERQIQAWIEAVYDEDRHEHYVQRDHDRPPVLTPEHKSMEPIMPSEHSQLKELKRLEWLYNNAEALSQDPAFY